MALSQKWRGRTGGLLHWSGSGAWSKPGHSVNFMTCRVADTDLVQFGNTFACPSTPCQEHDPSTDSASVGTIARAKIGAAIPVYHINNLVCELFPASPGMRPCLVRLHRETRVQHEDTVLSPARQVSARWVNTRHMNWIF